MIHTILYQTYLATQYYLFVGNRWFRKELTRLKLRKRGSFSNSSWVSLASRHWLEKDRIKAFLGAPVMAAALVGGVTQLPEADSALTGWEVSQPISEVLEYSVAVPTREGAGENILPTSSLLGISQGYHGGHAAVDLMAPLGSDVVSMDNGIVTLVEHSTLGYGRRVIVTHDNNIQSMYAHLGFMEATPGEIVAAGEKLGEIGMTGWSTGPHLHFEVFENGAKTNPLTYILPAIEAYQQHLTE